MSSTAEQHIYIFLTLILNSSFIAACNDMNFFAWALNLHCIFLYSNTIQRLNTLASRRPHSFFGSINFKAEILISFFLFKSLKHLISLFLSNIWCGRKKSKHCVVSSKARNLVKATVLMSLRFQTVCESFLYYLFTKFINT